MGVLLLEGANSFAATMIKKEGEYIFGSDC